MFKVLSIISSFNEEDVIYHVIKDLIDNQVDVYLIDNCSTDNTVEEAKKLLGKGLIHIESFPEDAEYSARAKKEYLWHLILQRKQQIAKESNADWIIHADADEFRESPFPNTSLSEGIAFVDKLGYNAINFGLYNFRPVDNSFVPFEDVRKHLTHYEPGSWFDQNQIKAWKNTNQNIDLVSSGGHSISFPDRKVFPIPFLLRHYPIRSEQHGYKKVMQDRAARFAEEERAAGWHVQYDEFIHGEKTYLWKLDDLTLFDSHQMRENLLSQAFRRFLMLQTDKKDLILNYENTLNSSPGNLETLQNLRAIYELFADKQSTFLVDGRITDVLSWQKNRIAPGNRETAQSSGAGKSSSSKISRGRDGSPRFTSIIIPLYNNLEYTQQCIKSLEGSTKLPIEVILVNNGSTDGTKTYIDKLVKQKGAIKYLAIHNLENVGFPGAVNQGLKASSGEYLVIANNDLIFTKNWLEKLVALIEQKNEYGIAAPISNYVSGVQIDKTAKYSTIDEMFAHAGKLSISEKGKFSEFPRVAFLCALIKREVLDLLGGLDERFAPGNFEDDDYCLRLQLSGYKTVIAHDVFIHHFGSKSFLADGEKKYFDRLEKNKQIFINKWGADPDEIWLKGKTPNKRKILIPFDTNRYIELNLRLQSLLSENDYFAAQLETENIIRYIETEKYNISENELSAITKLHSKLCMMNDNTV